MDVLKVDLVMMNVGPLGSLVIQPYPVAEGFEPPFQHPFGLVLLGGDQAYDIFVQALGGYVRVDVDGEAPLVVRVQVAGRRSRPRDYLGRCHLACLQRAVSVLSEGQVSDFNLSVEDVNIVDQLGQQLC